MTEATGPARIAFLIGDPARHRMLCTLMAGPARTAGELALDAGVAPATASGHLAQMVEAGLLEVARQGRHRYFRLANGEVAAVIESLLGAAASLAPRAAGPADPALRRARVCYDHLAGELAVHWMQAMHAHGHLAYDNGLALSGSGARWCAGVGIDVAALATKRRPTCRPCLDWSERRDHMAGALGAALLQALLDGGHARRVPDSRAVQVMASGERLLRLA